MFIVVTFNGVSTLDSRDYFTFTIVRNPFGRLLSLYSFCQTSPQQRSFTQPGWHAIKAISETSDVVSLKEQTRETYWPSEFSQFLEWLIGYKAYYYDFTPEKYIKCLIGFRMRSGPIQLILLAGVKVCNKIFQKY